VEERQVNRETAERCTILRGLVGSTVHGLHVNDGIEDRDEMGICVEPFEDAMALWAPFEQFIYRTAAEREGRDDARSTAGDLDLTIYSLRKWTRLALKGNPTIMLLLFTPEEQLLYCDTLGAELRALMPAIVSRRVHGPFLGYLQAQKQRLTGERGQKRIHRPELEEMYGFDTKYAMHMLRLGYQGVELLTTGRLSLPMKEPERSFLLDVRRGRVSEQECLTRAGELEQELTDLASTSPLPDEPDEEQVQQWVLSAYRRSW
jgi:predicted nucleotidyltransferase